MYLASTNDVRSLATAVISGAESATTGQGTYLKVLVACTQEECGAHPRQRNGRIRRLKGEELKRQLGIFNTIAKRFGAVVLEVAKKDGAGADIVRSRTAFHRSAASTIRTYIRSGHDVRPLGLATLTKASLVVGSSRRKLTLAQLERRAVAITERLEGLAKQLMAADPELARKALLPAFAALAAATANGHKPTRDPKEAMAEGRPLISGANFFVPMPGVAVREARAGLQ
jgi:hypothetical protein